MIHSNLKMLKVLPFREMPQAEGVFPKQKDSR